MSTGARRGAGESARRALSRSALTSRPGRYNVVLTMTARAQKIQRIGNSAGILLPAAWLARQGLKPGATVRVEIGDRRIVILPEDRSRDVPVDARFAREVAGFLKRNRAILERLT